ncbi:MAG: hypothetical protein CVT64_11255 [Actinobacteria bacterium HGW-Actinobacteria-4]|nr:MAG: hypothetical protein CVT64_11255 [Actinobacteria bacterium HGW-Actinobacteria-4]
MSTHTPAAPDHAAFADWDAAYVLGSLTPDDRAAYESHLDACARCQDAVAELAPMPGLLTRARPLIEDAEPLPVPPSNLIDLVQARERQRVRTLRQRVIAATAAVAAVVAIAVAVPIALSQSPVPTAVVAMAPVGSTSLTASVALTEQEWGTALAMDCVYGADALARSPYGAAGGIFVLWVIDDAGEASQVSTWAAAPGDTVSLTAGTAVPLAQIAALEIRTADGQMLLQALL